MQQELISVSLGISSRISQSYIKFWRMFNGPRSWEWKHKLESDFWSPSVRAGRHHRDGRHWEMGRPAIPAPTKGLPQYLSVGHTSQSFSRLFPGTPKPIWSFGNASFPPDSWMSAGEGAGWGNLKAISIYVPTSSYTRKSLSGIPSSTLSRFLHLIYALHTCHSLWCVGKSSSLFSAFCSFILPEIYACSITQSHPSLCDPMDCSP